MGYLGTKPQSGFISQEANQYFTGLTQNYIDLNQSISSLSSVIILVNGVVQENSDLTLTSSTRITLGATLVASDKVTCIYVAKISSTQAPSTGSVTSDMLAGSIANSKLANSSITLNGSAVSLGGSATISSDSGTESFLALLSSNQNVNDSAHTLAAFDSESYDVGSNYTNTSSNYKYTVPTAGKYRFYSTLAFATQGSYGVDWGQISLYKNGSNIHFVFTPTHQTSHAADVATAQIDITLDCAANDYFQIYGRNNWNSNTTQGLFYSDSSRRSWFGGYRIA